MVMMVIMVIMVIIVITVILLIVVIIVSGPGLAFPRWLLVWGLGLRV